MAGIRNCAGCKIAIALWAFLTMMADIPSASAQLQQPFVFQGSGSAVFAGIRNDATGAITEVNGSPFPSRVANEVYALDFKGRYLFAVSRGSSKVSMFTVDTNSGALQEVPTSPFASALTNGPAFVATEITGQYVFVVNSAGPAANEISVEVFQIDTINLALVPAGSLTVPGFLVSATNDPRGHAIYVFTNSTAITPVAELDTYWVDPTTGVLEQRLGSEGNHARSLVVDPQGALLITGQGQNEGQTSLIAISPTDGILSDITTDIFAQNVYPEDLVLDSTGKFLYATTHFEPGVVHLYSTDLLKVGALMAQAELPNSSPAVVLHDAVPDPTGPFLYADKVYQVDAQTGILSVAQSAPTVGLGAAFTRPLLGQPVSGPVPLLNPSALSFGSVTLGQTTSSQAIQIISNGDQALSLNSIAVTGDIADFVESDTCHAPTVLQPGKLCTVQIAFTPTIAGPRSAVLALTDNGSPKMLSASLSGTGVALAPAVALIPGSLDFGTETEGTTTQAKTVTLTNSGTAPLQISSVNLAGANSDDFALNNMCAGNIPVNGSCTISATFSPLAQGFRSTTITISDNAQNPIQTIAFGGSGTAAVTPAGTTSQNVAAGQTAAYPLTLTAGPGFTGSVALTCSGAPVGATCSVPATVQVTDGIPAAFSVAVKTSGAHAAFPYLNWPRHEPFSPGPVLFALALLLAVAVSNRSTQLRAKRMVWSGAFATIVVFAVFSVAGCGGAGGGTPPPPPPVVTPAGTFTITVTPAATSPSGKPLQLSPIHLTLNVTQ